MTLEQPKTRRRAGPKRRKIRRRRVVSIMLCVLSWLALMVVSNMYSYEYLWVGLAGVLFINCVSFAQASFAGNRVAKPKPEKRRTSFFWREVGRWIKRPTFYAALFAICIFLFDQTGGIRWREFTTMPAPPEPGLNAGDYGYSIDSSDMGRLQTTVNTIYGAASGFSVDVPILGGLFTRGVRFADEQLTLVHDAFHDITGITYQEAIDYGYTDMPYPIAINYSNPESVPIALEYADAEARIQTLNQSLGVIAFPLSPYTDSFLTCLTYEDAIAEYESTLLEEQFTRVRAQYFAEYLGIALGIFPVVLSTSILGKKRRKRMIAMDMQPLSAIRYVWTKYAAIAALFCALILVTALIPTIGAVQMRIEGHAVDPWAYVVTGITWLCPTVLVVLATGMFLSELTGHGVVAIPIIATWCAATLVEPWLAGPYPIYALFVYAFNNATLPKDWMAQIVANRILLVALSAALVFTTGWLYFRRHSISRDEDSSRGSFSP